MRTDFCLRPLSSLLGAISLLAACSQAPGTSAVAPSALASAVVGCYVVALQPDSAGRLDLKAQDTSGGQPPFLARAADVRPLEGPVRLDTMALTLEPVPPREEAADSAVLWRVRHRQADGLQWAWTVRRDTVLLGGGGPFAWINAVLRPDGPALVGQAQAADDAFGLQFLTARLTGIACPSSLGPAT
jgi:hypothetical protein